MSRWIPGLDGRGYFPVSFPHLTGYAAPGCCGARGLACLECLSGKAYVFSKRVERDS
jgi:hypothetical protein